MKSGTVQKILDWVQWALDKIKAIFSSSKETYREETKKKDDQVVQEIKEESEKIKDETEAKKPKPDEDMAKWWSDWSKK